MRNTDQKTLPVNQLRINAEVLLDNFRHFTSGGNSIAPVVKSNAYGHGAVLVAEILSQTEEMPFFIVASYAEAQQLRAGGITTPILVIGYVDPSVVAANQLPDVTFTAIDMDHLRSLEAAVTDQQAIHLLFDTGMHRYGIDLEQKEEAINFLKNTKQLHVTGIFSHLCDAFSGANDFTHQQIDEFNQVAAEVSDMFPSCRTVHLAATSGHPFVDEIQANTERVGIGLYGVDNFSNDFSAQPVLSFVSQITSLRIIAAGETVGYGRTYAADTQRVVATIPAGYYEGVDRRLSNRGTFRVSGKDCPIIGKVSMNATTIDVTDLSQRPQVGDTVEIISADPDASNSAANTAKLIDAVNYRITTQLSASLPRIVV